MTFRERIQQRNLRYKRQEQRIKKGLLVAFVIGAAAASIGLTESAEPEYTVKEYTVKPGDTLWDIVDKYQEIYAPDTYILDYKEEIMECNPGLRERHGQISPGDVIKIKVKNGRERER